MKIYNVGSRVMNTYLYRIKDGYVMIDTGYKNSYKKCSSVMAQEGISFDEVKYIFLTHAHDDHAGFLREVLDRYPNIVCFISDRAFSVLTRGQNSFEGGCCSRLALFFCRIMEMLGNGEHLFPAMDETYKNRFIEVTQENADEIGRMLSGRVLFTPGHTADSISLKVKDLVFCGDAAMNGFPSLHRITIWVENKEEFENSWQVLLDENVDYVYPAHGKRFRSGDLYKFKRKIKKMKLYPLKG